MINKSSIEGLVVVVYGESIQFVDVSFQHSNYGTITDSSGFFDLKIVENLGNLAYSYLGFQSKTIPLKEIYLNNIVILEESSSH